MRDADDGSDARPFDQHTLEPRDASGDAASDARAIHLDAAGGGAGCALFGAPVACMAVKSCTALANHTPYPGHCAGASNVECCIDTPSTAANPPVPSGYKLTTQSQVTPERTAWAVSILKDSATYPMFATATKAFGASTASILARVEWHPPDFQNGVVNRGVTL